MRSVVGRNLVRLMKHHYPDSPNRPKALSKDAGVSLSTVQRVIDGETGATIDLIEALAGAFDLSVYQLLIPELDVGNPQVVSGAMAAEKSLYRRYQQAKLGRFGTNEKRNQKDN